MCGITGVLNIGNTTPINSSHLQIANDAIQHRGPDDEGFFVENDFGMAMRRLSIIDLQGGRQPMQSPCQRFHICYNGEIYNYLELKLELKGLGHRFRTQSDCEVVLHAFMQWGPRESLRKLRGMYAFCIWDSVTKSLYLARDRMGIKPLYYVEHNGRFYFASEIRGLFIHSGLSRQIDLQALDAFMTVGFVTAPHTLFEGVWKLPPAHYLTIRGNHKSIHEYWRLDYTVESTLTKDDAIEQFSDLLDETVQSHLMSDVPLGALLSGGIDSTAIAALIRKAGLRPVKTVSIGFEEDYYDETEIAEASARFLGTDHHNLIFNQHSLDAYPAALYYREEPTADSVFVAFYYLFKACKQHDLKVVLSGEGSDELLGGYAWHRWEQWLVPWLRIPNIFIKFVISAIPLSMKRHEGVQHMAEVLNQGRTDIVQRFVNYIGIGHTAEKEELYSPEVKAILRDASTSPIITLWRDHLKPVADQPASSQLLWLQSRTRLVDWTNTALDKMSMAHSIEARPPFMDHRLWEYCASLPHQFKLGGSYLKPIEKSLLREAMRMQIPENVRRRRKKGLQVPHASWLAKSRLPDWAESMLSEDQIRKFDLFDPKATIALRDNHRNRSPGLATLLMAVLAIQTWYHIFIDGNLADSPPVTH